MINSRSKYYYLLLGIVVILLSFTQKKEDEKPLDIYKAIIAKYNGIRSINLEANYSIVDVGGVPKRLEYFKGKLMADKVHQYTLSYDSETIQDKDLRLIVAPNLKTIYIMKPFPNPLFEMTGLDSTLIDSAEILTTNGFHDISNKKLGMLSYSPILGAFRRVNVLFDLETRELKGFNMFFREPYDHPEHGKLKKPALKIRYTKHELNSSLNKKYFSYSHVLEKVKGEFQGKGKYKNFEIVKMD